ncbi:lytic transglycosylase [Nocardioides donggukensis]|uniref:Transglycosylase SLT domain-containing protein n=1 Tax=Nocardioides donggukensis TaxID=2774019 RepID=A0A927Q1Z4_9ACTN|nr:transglycosylase SLT domain-containing protein [Nocardioides donggukensis]MBD8869191.1 transglycosylase SLT domain-containing protein [Nocardioides donggukensis]
MSPTPPRPRRLLRLAVAGVAGAVLATTAGTGPAAADHGSLPPGRKIVQHTVQPGDTATGLAVRFHAWTAELVSHNHLGSAALLRVGDRIEIPVVRAAARRDRAAPQVRAQRTAPKQARKQARPPRRTASGHPTRAHVRRVVVRTARSHGIDPQLALAVSWQESGWQMHHVSSANAIGAMQVLPTTGTWMSLYAGRPLDLRTTRDNVLAGILLIRVLRDSTSGPRNKIGAYYQGLGAVREHGLYAETRAYVDNVLAIKGRLVQGRPPA